MSLKLNVGVSRKVGLPEFSSVGASCHLELELSEELLHADLDGFQRRVRDAYVACDQAVNDELARHRGVSAPAAAAKEPARELWAGRSGTPGRDGRPTPDARVARPAGRSTRKAATPSQVKAIYAIARRQYADLEGLLRDGFGVNRPEDLALLEASRFIDQLKAEEV